jgi:DNA-directed DNA polymerase III PolC
MFIPLRVRSNYSLLYGASRLDEILETTGQLGYPALALADRNAMYGAIPFYEAARAAGLRPILGVELSTGTGAAQESALVLARDLVGYRTLCRLVTGRDLDHSFDLPAALTRWHDGVFVIALSARVLPKLRGAVPDESLFAGLALYGDRSNRLEQDGLARAARQFRMPLVATPEIAFHSPSRHGIHRILRATAEGRLAAEMPLRDLAHPKSHLRPPGEMIELYRSCPEALAATEAIADACRLELPLGGHTFPSFPLPEGRTAAAHLARLAIDGLARRHGRPRPEARRRLDYELTVIEQLGFTPYFLIAWDIARFAREQGIPVVARGSAANSLVVYALGLSNVDPLEYDLYFERFLNPARTDCPDIDLDVCWRRRDKVIDYIYTKYGDGHVAMLATHTTYQAKSAFRDVAKACGLPPREVDHLTKLLPSYGASSLRDAIASFPECRSFPLDRPGMADILHVSELLDGYPRHLGVHVGGVIIADRPLTDYTPLQRAAKGVLITQYDMGPVERLGLVKMDILAQRSLSIIEDTCRMVEANHGIRVGLDNVPADNRDATAAVVCRRAFRSPPTSTATASAASSNGMYHDGDALTAETLRQGRTIGCFQIESPGMRNLLKMIRAADCRDVIHALSLIRPGPASSGMKERFVRRRLGQEPITWADPRLEELLGETYGVMLYQEDVLKVAHRLAGFPLEKADHLRKAMTKDRSGGRMLPLREEFVRGVLSGGGSHELAESLWEQIANFAGYSYCKAHACTYGQISYQTVWLKSRWPAEFLAAVLANQAGYYEQREYLEEARRWGVPIRPPDVNASDVECVARREPSVLEEASTTNKTSGAMATLARPCFASPPAGSRQREHGTPDGSSVVLRVGLRHVRSLTATHASQLVDERRRGGPYRSLDDLLLRVDLSREETENLIRGGALASFGRTQPELLWRLDNEYRRLARAADGGGLYDQATQTTADATAAVVCRRASFSAAGSRNGNGTRRDKPAVAQTATASPGSARGLYGNDKNNTRQDRSLIAETACVGADRHSRLTLPDYSARDRLDGEEHVLGLTPTAHPMALLGRDLNVPGRLPIDRLNEHVGRTVTVAGLLAASRRARTRTGEFMKFISLEDEHGLIECVLFPDAYQRYGHLLVSRGPYVARGTMDNQHGALTLTVAHLELRE